MFTYELNDRVVFVCLGCISFNRVWGGGYVNPFMGLEYM